ncbi:phosphopentomutase [Thermodesulfobacteriota bacterium]
MAKNTSGFKRAVIIVLDGVGIGALPDAHLYGDATAASLQHCAEAVGGLHLSNMERLGLGRIEPIRGVDPKGTARAAYGKMRERSPGKDTTTGHWEIAGCILDQPFATFPDGFPDEIVRPFCERIGTDIIANVYASGTEIIERFGREHLKTGMPILYTSVDSVFQIAAHIDVIPLERLYEICRIARELVTPHRIGRVIARPFTGGPGSFSRTTDRRDYSMEPPVDILTDLLTKQGIPVVGIGKIDDIFAFRGISEGRHTKGNTHGIDETLRSMKEFREGLIFTNLIDFDMLYGHRNDIEGYAGALAEFDRRLPELLEALSDEDLLIITSDHGCDPTTPGTDHTREYVPLLAYSPLMGEGCDLGTRDTFADAGATVAECLDVSATTAGTSFLDEIPVQKATPSD